MTTDENLLKEMLDRATNPIKDKVDELCARMFCMVVRSDVQLIEKALELILSKIRAINVTESIRAIDLLQECMSNCGVEFQNEVSKFRFLNDLIRMVSIKYDGEKTPVAIKQRITDCLLLWTTEFPQKTKIREVYEMLNKELMTAHMTSVSVSEGTKRESTLALDEKLFADLVHSNDPQNLRKANLLVLKSVSQDARRTELIEQYKNELEEVRTVVLLLNQMLDSFVAEGNKSTEDNLNLIRELYLSCKKHRAIVSRMPSLVDPNVNDKLLNEAFAVGDSLQCAIKRYKQVIVHPPMNGACVVSGGIAPSVKETERTDLLTELISDLPTSNVLSTSVAVPSSVSTKIYPLDELTDLFCNDSVAVQSAADTTPVELLGSFDLLNDAPTLPELKNTASVQTPPSVPQPVVEKRSFRDMPEIDMLSAALFQMSLPSAERTNSFKKDPEKVTLNDLAKERKMGSDAKTPPNTIAVTSPSNIAQHNLTSFENTSKIAERNSSVDKDQDDIMLNSGQDAIINLEQKINELPLKHLSEIVISLDDVEPTSEERLLLDDEDIKITLNFTKDRPSRHVSVLILTVVNKSKIAIRDFQFEASVRKPSKVRLLSPTASSIEPFKPFRQPLPINQVMLLLNPTGKPIDVTCIVGYKSGDDPDPIKESLVAKDIPYVN